MMMMTMMMMMMMKMMMMKMMMISSTDGCILINVLSCTVVASADQTYLELTT